ncbi:MAG TPA: DUF58 domain-containing protein [Acidobacteria bacterium]|nr:DUF58 domain-containing protein [Acidobacteriota bacterium]
MRPTRRAIAVAALGLPLALLPAAVDARLWPLWLAFLGTFALALGTDALLAPRRQGVRCRLEMPGVLAIGEEVEARLTVQVPAARPVPVEVVLDLSDLLRPVPPLAGRAAERGAVFPFRLAATRRGKVEVERAWVRVRGPLGWMEGAAKIELHGEATVVPDLRPIRAAALRFASEHHFRAGMRIERYVGDGTELDSLREHVHGDDPRAIDWRGSARHHRLITRQFRAERNRQVVLAVDSGRLMAEPLLGIPKLDHAVTAALLLSWVSLRGGDRVGWFSFDARVGQWAAPEGGAQVFPALRLLAGRLDDTDQETNFTLGLTALAQRLRRRSLVVVLTDFVDTITAELMVENLERLARRHLVIFVALRDPGLQAVAAAEPADLRQLNRAVVAGALLREREVVLQRLRGQGIQAIDATPAQVHPRLINTYLEIKRRERI